MLPTSSLDRYLSAARQAGCPRDQIENFIRAGAVLQPKQLRASAAARLCDHPDGPSEVGFGGARGGAKALALTTPLPTPTGWTTMGDVQPGDWLFDENGCRCRVTGVSPVMTGHEVFDVVFDDGTVIRADGDHLWETSTREERARKRRRTDDFRAKRRAIRPRRGKGKKPWLVLRNQEKAAQAILEPPIVSGIRTTKEIRESLTIVSCYGKREEINHSIAVAKPLKLRKKNLPVPSYVLGAWLGDGTASDSGFTSADAEILDFIRAGGYTLTRWGSGKYRYGIACLKGQLRALGVLSNKHIPQAYLRASREQRIALLAGLMDTDGSVNEDDGGCEFTNCNKTLIEGVHELLISLGVRCRISEGRAVLNGKDCGPKYRIVFSANFPVFRLSRKAEKQKITDAVRKYRRFIVAVNPVPSEPVKCVTVDSPSHLYLAGRSMVPTHNSHWMLAQMALDDCQRFSGIKCLLLRKVGKANKENFEDLRQRVLPGIPHEYKRHEGVLVFPNGSRIILGHFQHERDVDTYLGLEYDIIGTEEATTLSAAKNEAIGTCNRTSKLGFRPRRYYTTNPGGIGHAWFKELFIVPSRNGRETDTRFIHATCDDNQFLNPEYRRRVLDALTGWKLRAWRYGDWDIAAGQFFTTFLADAHVCEPFPLEKNWRKWLGFDYGFVHYTSAHLFAEDGDGMVYVADEYAQRREIPEENAEGIKAMLARHDLTLSHLWKIAAGADVFNTREHGGTIANTYAELGVKLSRANIDRINGAGEILKRLGDPAKGREPTIKIFNRCARLIECLPSLEHDPQNPEDVDKVHTDDEGRGGDDFYDSFRYGCMEAARPKVRPPAAGPPTRLHQVGPIVPNQGFATGLRRG